MAIYPGIKGDWRPGTTRVDVTDDGTTWFSGISEADGCFYVAKKDPTSTNWHNPVKKAGTPVT